MQEVPPPLPRSSPHIVNIKPGPIKQHKRQKKAIQIKVSIFLPGMQLLMYLKYNFPPCIGQCSYDLSTLYYVQTDLRGYFVIVLYVSSSAKGKHHTLVGKLETFNKFNHFGRTFKQVIKALYYISQVDHTCTICTRISQYEKKNKYSRTRLLVVIGVDSATLPTPPLLANIQAKPESATGGEKLTEM